MDQLFNTFMHSMAWHVGTNFANMLGMPLISIFVAYGIYKFTRKMIKK